MGKAKKVPPLTLTGGQKSIKTILQQNKELFKTNKLLHKKFLKTYEKFEQLSQIHALLTTENERLKEEVLDYIFNTRAFNYSQQKASFQCFEMLRQKQ